MHDITELPAWERLFKKIVWTQLGNIEGKRILDFEAANALLDGENSTAYKFGTIRYYADNDILEWESQLMGYADTRYIPNTPERRFY